MSQINIDKADKRVSFRLLKKSIYTFVTNASRLSH